MRKQLLLLTCALGALGLGAGGAVAATATAAAVDNSQNATTVGDLVVVAEKRETNLQKVPVAVSVFTGAQRDLVGINSVQDVTNFAPGFTYNPGNVHAYIRGVGRQSISVTDDARVSTYEDEFYVYSPYQLDKSSLFLTQEQIERGPQNVGGRNADGGSIDMISVRPTDHPYAEVRATVGNFGTYNIEGAASGELAPGLDVRVAGYDHNQDQGFYKNVSGGPSEGNQIHEWYIEGQVQAKLSDQADFWGRMFVSGWNDRGDAGSRTGPVRGSWDETNLTDANTYPGAGLFVNANYGYAALPGAAQNAARAAGLDVIPSAVSLANPNILNNPSTANPNNFSAIIPRDVTLKNYADINYIFTYHFPDFDFKYVGGYQGYDYDLNYGDEDTNVKTFTLPGSSAISAATAAALHLPPPSTLVINPLVDLNYAENDQWTSHEVSLASTNDSKLQWIGGAFFYFQHYTNPISAETPGQPQLATPLNDTASAPAALNPNRYIFFQDYDISDWSEAGYAQASWKFNDQFKLTVNGRYTNDYKSGTETARYVVFNNSVIDGYSGFYGAYTPSLDYTIPLTCPTGIGISGASASCYGGPLAKGVTKIGTVEANGNEVRGLGGGSSAWTGGAGLEWTPTEDIFIYARYNRGYEDLTFNAGFDSPSPEVAPEFINDYELGYKQSIGHSLTIDIDGFYYDYSNLQVPISVANGGVTQTDFVNAPKSMSAGVEFESYWQPIKDMLVTFTYSYNDTEILTGCTGSVSGGVFTAAPGAFCLVDTNDPNAVAAGAHPVAGQSAGTTRDQSVKGNPLPEAPRNKLALSAAYTWHFDPGSLTLTGAYIWRDTQDGTLFNRAYDNAPAWDDVDLRVEWKGKNDRYEVIGYLKNVFNTLQYVQGTEGAGLLGTASSVTTAAAGLDEVGVFQLAPPRTFGVEVRYKFF